MFLDFAISNFRILLNYSLTLFKSDGLDIESIEHDGGY